MRVQVHGITNYEGLRIGFSEPPQLSLRGGVDLCDQHLTQLQVRDGHLVLVDHGPPPEPEQVPGQVTIDEVLA